LINRINSALKDDENRKILCLPLQDFDRKLGLSENTGITLSYRCSPSTTLPRQTFHAPSIHIILHSAINEFTSGYTRHSAFLATTVVAGTTCHNLASSKDVSVIPVQKTERKFIFSHLEYLITDDVGTFGAMRDLSFRQFHSRVPCFEIKILAPASASYGSKKAEKEAVAFDFIPFVN